MKEQLRNTSQFEVCSLRSSLYKRVLLVDSNPIVAKQMGDIISRLNHLSLGSVCCIEKIEQQIVVKNPDYIFVNIATSGSLNGYQITKILKLDYEIPYALIINDNSSEERKWAEELNPDSLILYSHDESLMKSQVKTILT